MDDARTRAARRVAWVRDDPAQRYELAGRFYWLAAGARRRFGTAELGFLRWSITRGVLAAESAQRRGSPWWRAVNERLLRDKVEADLLWGGALGEPSGRSVEFWLAFIRRPDPVSWYRAHNASIVAAYLEHEPLTYAELRVERFMMNVALLRVLFSYALVAKPRLALGRLGFFGPLVADPRRRSVQLFLDLRRSFPNAYPLAGPLEKAIADEAAMARALDYGVIAPRLPELYDFSAVSLEEPRLPDLLMQGTPAYAWSPEDRMIWYSGITGGHLRAIALATGAATGFDRLVNRRSPIK